MAHCVWSNSKYGRHSLPNSNVNKIDIVIVIKLRGHSKKLAFFTVQKCKIFLQLKKLAQPKQPWSGLAACVKPGTISWRRGRVNNKTNYLNLKLSCCFGIFVNIDWLLPDWYNISSKTGNLSRWLKKLIKQLLWTNKNTRCFLAFLKE